MIRKTEGIVLHTRKYRETSLLTTVYTREYGKASFIVQGARAPRARNRHSYYQPMSNIDMVYYHKDSRDLQQITESSNHHYFHQLQVNPRKIALGLPVIEIFDQAVREVEEQNVPLYEFLKAILIAIDETDTHPINLFLYYLVQLPRYLGFQPQDEVAYPEKPVFFNLTNGTLSNSPSEEKADYLMLQMLRANLATCLEINFNNPQKRELIRQMLQYYRIHLDGFREPGSLEVFAEVFS
ncbi:MAG: DNA repair protein RecO [Bacteroidia bacterium]|nr:DNA repair protein RecO [Bacteroidia bacterium]